MTYFVDRGHSSHQATITISEELTTIINWKRSLDSATSTTYYSSRVVVVVVVSSSKVRQYFAHRSPVCILQI